MNLFPIEDTNSAPVCAATRSPASRAVNGAVLSTDSFISSRAVNAASQLFINVSVMPSLPN